VKLDVTCVDRVSKAAAGVMTSKTAVSGTIIAIVVLAVAWLAYPGAPAAWTTGPAVTAEGRIVLLDLDAKSFTILGRQGTQEFHVRSDTAIDVGGTRRIAFTDLPRFIGTNCTVLSADTGESQDASRVQLQLPLLPARASAPKDVRYRTSYRTGSVGTMDRGSR